MKLFAVILACASLYAQTSLKSVSLSGVGIGMPALSTGYAVNHPDRRPVMADFMSSHSNSTSANPRGWNFATSYTIGTDNGTYDAFRTLAVAHANSVITQIQARSIQPQAILLWDMEGQEFVQSISYIGDPRFVGSGYEPEMNAAADAMVSAYTTAGYQVGFTLRAQSIQTVSALPSTCTYNATNDYNSYFIVMGASFGNKFYRCNSDGVSFTLSPVGYSSGIGTDAGGQTFFQPGASLISNQIALLEAKINYARTRWGAKIFYVDTAVNHSGGVLDDLVFRQLITDFPDTLFFPEQHDTGYYATNMPYSEPKNNAGDPSLPGSTSRAAWPLGTIGVNLSNCAGDAGTGGCWPTRLTGFTNGVAIGDIAIYSQPQQLSGAQLTRIESMIQAGYAQASTISVTDTSTSTVYTYNGSPASIYTYPLKMRVYFAASDAAMPASTTYCEAGQDQGQNTCSINLAGLTRSQIRYYDHQNNLISTFAGTAIADQDDVNLTSLTGASGDWRYFGTSYFSETKTGSSQLSAITQTNPGSSTIAANRLVYPYWTDGAASAPLYYAVGGNSQMTYVTNQDSTHNVSLAFTVAAGAARLLTVWAASTGGASATMKLSVSGNTDTIDTQASPGLFKYVINIPASASAATVSWTCNTPGTSSAGQPAIALFAAAIAPVSYTPVAMPVNTISSIADPMTTYSVPAVSTTTTLSVGDDLQAAVNAASDASSSTHTRILLPQGYRWTGNCTLPHRTNGSWVTIQSVASQSLTSVGRRVAPADFGTGAGQIDVQLTTSNGEAVFWPNMPGFSANTIGRVSNNYRFVGLEVAPISAQTVESYSLFRFPIAESNYDGSTVPNSAYRPNHIIIERSYLHGRNGTYNYANAGVSGSMAYLIVQDSWLDNFHSTYREANAFATTSAQQYRLINNMLEGCGENIMHGGAGPDTPLEIPGNGTIQYNYFRKRLSWNGQDGGTGGDTCTEKNLLEIKIGQDITIDHNVLENSPAVDQGGNVFQLSPTSQNGGGAANTIQRVALTNNIVLHGVSGGSVFGQDRTGRSDHYSPQSGLTTVNNINYSNNFFMDLGVDWTNGNYNAFPRMCFYLNGNPFLSKNPGPDALTLSHTTCLITEINGQLADSYKNASWRIVPENTTLGQGYLWGEQASDASITYNYFPSVPAADGPSGGYAEPGSPYLPSQSSWHSPSAVVDHNCFAQTQPITTASQITSNSTNSTVAATCSSSTIGAPISLLDYTFAIKSGNRSQMPSFPR